jgi:hypothetical protein
MTPCLQEETFMPLPIIDMMMLKDEDWLVQYLAHKPARGKACAER